MHEEALRQSEERFRLLVEGVTDYAIYMLDVDGLVTSWNAGAQRITGYTRDEILGAHFSRFYRGRRARHAAVGGARERARAPAGSRPKAGACARTASASGRAWW